MKVYKRLLLSALVLSGILFSIKSCKTYYFRENYQDANAMLHNTERMQERPFLKAHLKNGDVCIFKNQWQYNPEAELIEGMATRYDFNRNLLKEGLQQLPVDSIVIFETNRQLEDTQNGELATLGLLAMVNTTFNLLCLSNPKACYGSCPTFYFDENQSFHYSRAEGFSSAIAPSMEYSDIDALNVGAQATDTFKLVMKNEALETHCVKELTLLAAPHQPGEQVYHAAGNKFYRCQGFLPARTALAAEGDVSHLLAAADYEERFSLADAQNLNSREAIILEFDNPQALKKLGLVAGFRQTLMTTYLIYSALGYMGDEVSDVFAKIEKDQDLGSVINGGLKTELGEVEIYLFDSKRNTWTFQGSFYETGPIAVNQQLLALNTTARSGPLKLKVVLNKGLWRLDYLALTEIVDTVEPIQLKPELPGKAHARARANLADPDRYLVSMPGEAYHFNFHLPEGPQNEYDLFLNSRGYYLEWMRENWFKQKDLLKLRQMIKNPEAYLKSEAAEYKFYEATMEDQFWSSRVTKEKLSHYDAN